MDIMINQVAIAAAVQRSIDKAVADAFGGYEVNRAIANAIVGQVTDGAIGKALAVVTTQIDTGKLVTALAGEIERATTRAVVRTIEEALISLVCKLRNIPEYGDEAARKRAAVRSELFPPNE